MVKKLKVESQKSKVEGTKEKIFLGIFAFVEMKYVEIFVAITFSVVSFIAFTAIAHAQNITFEATVDKTLMYFEDTLVLSFILSEGSIDMNVTPNLPDLKEDFDVLRGPSRSTSISIVNGRQSSSLTLQYLLSPKKTGALTIGPATLQYNNKTYSTKPITIEVIKGTQPPSPSPSQGTPSPPQQGGAEVVSRPYLFIRAEADKQTAYVGEQITLSYYLYRDREIEILDYGVNQQPSFIGFWIEELKVPSLPRDEIIDGVRYRVALMKKVALFPTSIDVTIEPMVMTFIVTTDPFSFFSRRQKVIRKTPPVELEILPLPEKNKPDTFNGDVGNFTMSVDVDKTQVKQDEPIPLTVKIQGIGNIKTVKEPKIVLPESFKRYDPEIREIPFTLQEPIQGEKIFESVIIPSSTGEFRIEPVQFSYFDPQRKAYQTIRSEPISIVILPTAQEEEPIERRIATKEEIKLLGQDIRFIKTDIPQLVNQGQYWYQTGLFRVMFIVPLLAIVAAYRYKRYKEKYRSDERYMRWKRARKLSKQRFKTAAKMMNRGDAKEFYAAISYTLRQYLGDKFNLPPAGITGEEISQILKNYGLDEETAELLKRCLADCDFARFAPVGSSAGEMNTMLRNAETIIDRIEKLKLQGSKLEVQGSKKLLLLILLPATSYLLLATCYLLPVTCFAEVSVEEIFQQGNRLYEEGKYSKAIESYQSIVNSGVKNGYLYYNLGNALLKKKRVGEAILAYERAKRLLPRDEDVAFNLEYARASTLDKMEGWYSGKFASMMVSIRDFFTPNEVSVFFLAVYLLLAILIIMFIFAPRRWKTRLIYWSILPASLFLISGILLFFQISYKTSIDEAILLAPKSEARTGPGEGYSTVFEIHEGAKVRIQRERLDWVEIKLPNKVIGWVMKRDLEKINQES